MSSPPTGSSSPGGWVEDFPGLSARTRRFTLGAPRSVTVSEDGTRVVFLRSAGPTDPVTGLWVLDVRSGEERLVVDPRYIASGPVGEPAEASEAVPPAAERARRERLRESAEGITSYALDRAAKIAVFALDGRGVMLAELDSGQTIELPAAPAAVDPRPAPNGRAVAYVSDGHLRLLEADPAIEGGWRDPAYWRDRAWSALVTPADAAEVGWGLAEFIAAEEMHRFRGYWWAPDSSAVLAARVDSAAVSRWHLAEASDPSLPCREVAYPAAGSPNAEVSLWLLRRDGTAAAVSGWDSGSHPYLASVAWTADGPPLLAVQSRDQRSVTVLSVDPVTATATPLCEIHDEHWVELVPGAPAWTPDGAGLLTVEDSGGARRLMLDGRDLTGDEVQVRALLDVGPRDALVLASEGEPTEVHVLAVSWDQPQAQVRRFSDGPGVHSATRGGTVTVLSSSTPQHEQVRLEVRRPDAPPVLLSSRAATSGARLRAHRLTLGSRGLRVVLVLPSWYEGGPLPVVMSPYGGPHAQMVLATAACLRTAQWYAEHGFAVVVADGRGTPGRGPDWEKAVAGDLAGPVLQDQVDALHAVAEAGLADLDLGRVGIRGWSFGGYLAALAVLRRPEVFHAAVAGAPVTDWSLYDTHYTERYLSLPSQYPDAYRRSSLIDDALVPPDDEHPARPLLLIHGMADDNVYVAHTLRLSAALLASGRQHSVLPMSGVTHFTPQVSVAENVSRFDLSFLQDALGA